MLRIILLVGALCFGFIAPAQAQQFITVDFNSGQLWHLYGEGQRDVYPVVLPKTAVQEQMRLNRPVLGRLREMDYHPTWWPTSNMRRRDPGLPAAIKYGQPGHPIGVYRLRIAWSNPRNPNFWQAVRIHGGAKPADLHGAKSAGCVRMLNEDIERLVAKIKSARQQGEGDVQTTFGFF